MRLRLGLGLQDHVAGGSPPVVPVVVTFEDSGMENALLPGTTARTVSMTVDPAAGKTRLVAVAMIRITSTHTIVGTQSVAIDGEAAEKLEEEFGAEIDSAYATVSFWEAPGTANTDIDVVATPVDNNDGIYIMYCACWTIDGDHVLVDSEKTSSALAMSADVQTVVNGAAVSAALAYNASGVTAAWTGLTESTELQAYGNDFFTGAATSAIGSAENPRDIVITPTPAFGVNGRAAMISLSFGPS